MKEKITALLTATTKIEPNEGQIILKSERGKSYEIWQQEPLRLIKRIPEKRVCFVFVD